jgi:hypothetical protein
LGALEVSVTVQQKRQREYQISTRPEPEIGVKSQKRDPGLFSRSCFVSERVIGQTCGFAVVRSLSESFAVETSTGIQILNYGIIALAAAVGAYLRRKAENRARRGDIENLTELVERARTEYARQLGG